MYKIKRLNWKLSCFFRFGVVDSGMTQRNLVFSSRLHILIDSNFFHMKVLKSPVESNNQFVKIFTNWFVSLLPSLSQKLPLGKKSYCKYLSFQEA